MALPLDVTAPLYSALLALKKSTGFAAVYESKDLRLQVISFLKPQTFDGKLALSPREFSGRRARPKPSVDGSALQFDRIPLIQPM